LNVIITGVGGQGNVTASRIVASMLVGRGFVVTVGETFGASQRGGSVMSHIRVSARRTYSPQVPRGRADVVVSLEPLEAVRVLAAYGNPRSRCLTNDRPVYPVRVIAGEVAYPGMDEIKKTIGSLCEAYAMIGATEAALELGNPVLQNVVMIGALEGLGLVPFTRDDFVAVIGSDLSEGLLELNLKAYDVGFRLAGKAAGRACRCEKPGLPL